MEMNSWLSNIVDNTIAVDHAFWQNAFQQMERQAKIQADSMKGPFIFHDEVDDPSEMLYYPTVTLEQVQRVGKTNWIEDMDGNFYTVNDATMEELFDNDKIVHGKSRARMAYNKLSISERVAYRVEHQHITERMAREFVGEEIGESLFRYTFIYKVTTVIDGDEPRQWDDHFYIEADSKEEAYEILNKEYARPVGFVICTGYDYVKRCTTKDFVKENIIELVNIVDHQK